MTRTTKRFIIAIAVGVYTFAAVSMITKARKEESKISEPQTTNITTISSPTIEYSYGYDSGCVTNEELKQTREWLYEQKLLNKYYEEGIGNIGVKAYENSFENSEGEYVVEFWTEEEDDLVSDDGEDHQSNYFVDDVSAASGYRAISNYEYEILCKLCYAEQTRVGYSQKDHDKEVANIVYVVLNRVNSDEFPNSIEGVIFDRKNGVQFSPANINGTISWFPKAGEKATLKWSDVPEETKRQVQDALDGRFKNRGYLFYHATDGNDNGNIICNTVFY